MPTIQRPVQRNQQANGVPIDPNANAYSGSLGAMMRGPNALAKGPQNAFNAQQLGAFHTQGLEQLQGQQGQMQAGLGAGQAARGIAGPSMASVYGVGNDAANRGALAKGQLESWLAGANLGNQQYQNQVSGFNAMGNLANAESQRQFQGWAQNQSTDLAKYLQDLTGQQQMEQIYGKGDVSSRLQAERYGQDIGKMSYGMQLEDWMAGKNFSRDQAKQFTDIYGNLLQQYLPEMTWKLTGEHAERDREKVRGYVNSTLGNVGLAMQAVDAYGQYVPDPTAQGGINFNAGGAPGNTPGFLTSSAYSDIAPGDTYQPYGVQRDSQGNPLIDEQFSTVRTDQPGQWSPADMQAYQQWLQQNQGQQWQDWLGQQGSGAQYDWMQQ